MKEHLRIFSSDGELLLERDLAGIKKPLMVLSGEMPQIVEVVPQGAQVLGALVRDEDGWTLASASSESPVSSGPKVGADIHLTAGIACSLGQWIFRIEREGSATGTVLLWRVGRSSIAADHLAQGKNVVALSKDGSCAVNPAVVGEEMCEIFPTESGVDVLTGGEGGERLSVPFATLFAAGPLQAMAIPAAEATQAVKSGDPFGWPSRKTRTGLLAMVMLAGLVCLGALALVKEKRKVDAAFAARPGSVQLERELEGSVQDSLQDEDVFVYRLSFYRSLPLILTPDRSPITCDLILRGRQLPEKDVGDMVRFLEEVDTIQDAVHRGDWDTLNATLAESDKMLFTAYDADRFYSEARQIADFITVALPRFLASVSEIGAENIAIADEQIKAYFEKMSDNMFMSGDIVRRERDNAEERWQALSAYLEARDRFLSSQSPMVSELQEAWISLLDGFDPENLLFADMVEREREQLVGDILRRATEADAVTLIRLCALGETLGIADDVLAVWRSRAAESHKALSARYRELYSEYRMRAAVAPDAPETLSVLDDMTALGLDDNPYHQWALREKERVAAKRMEEGK